MTLRLRAHHLLCLLTYVGEGYSADFIANLDQVTRRLRAGEDIRLVDGPDDICAPLGSKQDHCAGPSAAERDRMAADAIAELLGQDIPAGTKLSLSESELARLRTAFVSGLIRQACSGCEWADLCSSIAARGYESARL
jgi:hypothetical protein